MGDKAHCSKFWRGQRENKLATYILHQGKLLFKSQGETRIFAGKQIRKVFISYTFSIHEILNYFMKKENDPRIKSQEERRNGKKNIGT